MSSCVNKDKNHNNMPVFFKRHILTNENTFEWNIGGKKAEFSIIQGQSLGHGKARG